MFPKVNPEAVRPWYVYEMSERDGRWYGPEVIEASSQEMAEAIYFISSDGYVLDCVALEEPCDPCDF